MHRSVRSVVNVGGRRLRLEGGRRSWRMEAGRKVEAEVEGQRLEVRGWSLTADRRKRRAHEISGVHTLAL